MSADPSLFYAVFLETGIIAQLSRAMLEKRLPEGLIQPHFTVLSHLTRVQDGRTPLDLARAFQVPKNSMTHTLKGLQSHALIDLIPHPDDGRSKQAWLTDKGRQLHSSIISDMGPAMQQLAAEFDTEKLATVLPVLTELRQFLDARREDN